MHNGREWKEIGEYYGYLFNVVLLFAKQNIAYRGHHEDSKYVDDPNYNSGNYQ